MAKAKVKTMRIKMLRNLPIKPGVPERNEGEEYTVKEKEGRTLIAQGLAIDPTVPVEVPEPESDDEEEVEEEDDEPADDLDVKTVPDLKAIATAEGVTVTSVRKDDLLKAIRDHRAAKANG